MSDAEASSDKPEETPEPAPAEPEAARAPTAKEKFTERLRQPMGLEDEPEVVIWQGGFSPKALYGEWFLIGIVCVALLGGGGYLLFANMVPWAAWALFILVGAAVLYEIFKLVYKRVNVRYRLTNQRFIHEEGIIRRITDRIEVIDINDVGFDQGFVERFFGVGTIRIKSTDATHPTFRMKGIENVEEVAHQLDDARRKERIRRGVQVINT